MKIITPELEAAHYSAVVKSGSIGGAIGLGVGLAGVMAASRRYPAFQSLTIPFRTFLVTSSGTFAAIVCADRASINFERSQNPNADYKTSAMRAAEAARQNLTTYERAMRWGRENRYSIVMASWVASMGGAFAAVGRDKYMSTAQKIVQARVYAQGLTLAVLLITALFEMTDAKSGTGRWEEKIWVEDPNDPTHQHMIEKIVHKERYQGQDLWKDMIASEERRLADAASRKGEVKSTQQKTE